MTSELFILMDKILGPLLTLLTGTLGYLFVKQSASIEKVEKMQNLHHSELQEYKKYVAENYSSLVYINRIEDRCTRIEEKIDRLLFAKNSK